MTMDAMGGSAMMPDLAEAAPPRCASIAERLRAETRTDHESIEANPRMMRLVSSDLTRTDYVAILFRLLGFHAPAEQGLRRWAPRFPPRLDIEARLVRAELLHRDLGDLGIEAARIDAAPRDAFGNFRSIEAAWGCLYVVEGASLGGQIIARGLKATLGVTSQHGAAFHTPYGPMTGARWQGFKAALSEEVDRGVLDVDAVVAGARAAFAAMDRWMSGEGDAQVP